jgi:hypothetical protein
LFFVIKVQAQRPADAGLQNRLNDCLHLTKEMNLAKAFEYMHPKLFAIVPNGDLVKSTEIALKTRPFPSV